MDLLIRKYMMYIMVISEEYKNAHICFESLRVAFTAVKIEEADSLVCLYLLA